VRSAAEAAAGGDEAKETLRFGTGQGVFVLAGEEEGSQYPEGEDDAGGGLALGVVLVSEGLEQVVLGVTHLSEDLGRTRSIKSRTEQHLPES